MTRIGVNHEWLGEIREHKHDFSTDDFLHAVESLVLGFAPLPLKCFRGESLFPCAGIPLDEVKQWTSGREYVLLLSSSARVCQSFIGSAALFTAEEEVRTVSEDSSRTFALYDYDESSD